MQSDKTLLLEIEHGAADECRRAIAAFAELERSPEHIHTYRLTALGLWNARAAGLDAESVIDVLLRYSRYAVPHSILIDIAETMARYGRLRLETHYSRIDFLYVRISQSQSLNYARTKVLNNHIGFCNKFFNLC